VSAGPPKKTSNLPFTPPVSRVPVTPSKKGSQSKKPISPKQQLRNAKRSKNKSPISVRSLITGLAILIATSVAVTAVISPGLLSKLVSGELIENTSICKVTEMNSSIFFDTTCGKFEWDTARQPGTPSAKLVKGETYTFKSIGVRIGPAHMFPKIVSYEQSPAGK